MQKQREVEQLLVCIAGSRAYGLATPESDHDTRGVCAACDKEYLYGIGQLFDGTEDKATDTVLFDVRRFVSLAIKANTQCLEVLFSPENLVVKQTAEGRYLRQHKHLFMTQQVYATVKGYAFAERRRTLAKVFDRVTGEEVDFHKALAEGKDLDAMVVEFQGTRNLGAKRKADLLKHGYSPKNASHCLRLLYCGATALQTGEFPVSLTGEARDFIFAAKQGKLTRAEFETEYERLEQELEVAGAESTLPKSIDFEAVNRLTVDVLEQLQARGVFK